MNYRTVSTYFWTDSKVDDEFTPEDKYFFLYLLTNPHTNICGCYEISTKQMERETGYNKDTINRLLERMESYHNVICFNAINKEVLIKNWGKYNWTKSEKLVKAVLSVSKHIKTAEFRNYILNQITEEQSTDNSIQSTEYSIQSTDVSIEYEYPIDTVSDKPKKPKLKKEITPYFPGYPEVEEAFSDYVKARKEIKAVMSDKAKTLASNKLRKMCTDSFGTFDTEHAIRLVNDAIEHGWKSFYETNESNKSKQSKQSEIEGWFNS